MSKHKSSPAYPVRGFIISGDPTTTVSVSGCRKLSATETSIRRVAAPGSANRYATSALKPTLIKPIDDDQKLNFVPYSSSEPSISMSSNICTEYKHFKNDFSAMQTKFPAHLSNLKQEDNINHNSSIFETSLSVSMPTYRLPPKHKTPSKRAFTTRRSAYKIMNRFDAKPADELTEKERNSLQWAKTIIKGLNRSAPPIEDGESSINVEHKRRRSEEESTLHKPKHTKNTHPRPQTKSYKDLAKDHIIWAIVDRSASDGTISSSNWRSVVIPAITAKFLKIIRDNPGPPPQCEDVGWYQGHIKLIACADGHSAQMYKTAVESLGEIWPGAKIRAIPLANVQQRPRSIGKFPATPSDPNEILEILQASNPQLPTWNWKVIQVNEAIGGTRKATVILNSDSLPLLRATEGKVFYGFGTVILKVYKGDDKETPKSPERIINYSFGCEHSSYNEYFPSVSRLMGEWDDNCEDINFTVIDCSEGYSN